jgi:hypothetical protein
MLIFCRFQHGRIENNRNSTSLWTAAGLADPGSNAEELEMAKSKEKPVVSLMKD